MQPITRHALRVTAALNELRGKNEDVLDALIPFFEPILEVMNNTIFDPGLLAVGVQRLYRWRFTRDVAEAFIPRLQQKGYLQRKGTNENRIYLVTYSPNNCEEKNTVDMENFLKEAVAEFAMFSPRVTDLLHYNRSSEELADVLIRFLIAEDAFTGDPIVIKSGSGNDTVIGALEEGGFPLSHEDKYMAARFVKQYIKGRPSAAEHFARLAAVGLLTEVADDFARPVGIIEKTEIKILLDAPLALDYLGLSGKNYKNDVCGVLDALKQKGASLQVFPATCDEMARNLKAMLGRDARSRHGVTHEAMVRGEVMPEFVEAVAKNPERALENVGITVLDRDLESTALSSKFFNGETYEDFLRYVTWVEELKPREHDAKCLALTMRLRQGQNNIDLLQSSYVFVTRNPAFARRSREYLLQSRMLYERQESPVVHQRDLAVAAWLRTGLQSVDKIPLSSMVVACDRVLRLNPDVPQAVAARLKEANEPDKLEQFQLLLQDSRSIQKLADNTLNDERVVTPNNAALLLDAMKKAAIEEERAELEIVLTQVKADNSSKQRSLMQQLESQKAIAETYQRERDNEALKSEAEIKRLNDALENAKKEKFRLLELSAEETNKILEWMEWASIVILIIIGLAFWVWNLFQLIPMPLFLKIFGSLSTLYGGYAAALRFIGWTPLGFRPLVEKYGRNLLSRKLSRLPYQETVDDFKFCDLKFIIKEIE